MNGLELAQHIREIGEKWDELVPLLRSVQEKIKSLPQGPVRKHLENDLLRALSIDKFPAPDRRSDSQSRANLMKTVERWRAMADRVHGAGDHFRAAAMRKDADDLEKTAREPRPADREDKNRN